MAPAAVWDATDQDGSERSPGKGAEAPPANPSKLFVGPGFEIVVRADEGRAFDMTVDTARHRPARAGHERRRGQREPRAGPEAQDPDLTRRVELVEASLMDLVDQMEEMERKVDEVLRAARAPPRSG